MPYGSACSPCSSAGSPRIAVRNLGKNAPASVHFTSVVRGQLRSIAVLLIAVSLAVVLSSASTSSAGPGPVRPLVIPGLAADSPAPLHACDPVNPTMGDFTVEQPAVSTVAGIDGQVV